MKTTEYASAVGPDISKSSDGNVELLAEVPSGKRKRISVHVKKRNRKSKKGAKKAKSGRKYRTIRKDAIS